MAKPDSWMPFYWGDFWRDTGHLTPAEGWAYINLIGAYWIKGSPLEADEDRLQRLAKVTSLSEWERVRKSVLSFFELTETEDGNCYRHSRIDRELAKATKAYAGRVKHMEAVNAKRRAKQSPSPVTEADTVSVTVQETQTLPTDTVTQPQPHSPIGEKKDTSLRDGADAPLKAKIFREGLEFLAKATGKNPDSLRGLVGKWCSENGDELTLKAIIEAEKHSPLAPIPYCERVLKNAKIAAAAAPTTAEMGDPEENLWRARASNWKPGKYWNRDQWGPTPNEPGCRVPAHLLPFDPERDRPAFLKRA